MKYKLVEFLDGEWLTGQPVRRVPYAALPLIAALFGQLLDIVALEAKV